MSALIDRRFRSGSDELSTKVELFEVLVQVMIYYYYYFYY